MAKKRRTREETGVANRREECDKKVEFLQAEAFERSSPESKNLSSEELGRDQPLSRSSETHHNNKRSMKRKRRETKVVNISDTIPNSKVGENTGADFFRGKVFSCTIKGDEEDKQSVVSDPSECTFSEVKRLVSSAGGNLSSILHKRVFALIASKGAVLRRTQRIRKALKYDVPIVTADFLYECHAKKKCLAPDDFLTEVEEVEVAHLSKNSDMTLKPVSPSDDSVSASSDIHRVIIDCGCCCICHESGNQSCEWCVSSH